jgi:hypothetical protein
MSRNRGMPRPRPTPRPTLKLVWSVVVPPAAGAGSEGVAVFVGVASEVVDVFWLLVVDEVVEESVLVAEALLVSAVEVSRVSEVDVLLALVSSVRVLSATTALLDVLETLDVELEELTSVMLK